MEEIQAFRLANGNLVTEPVEEVRAWKTSDGKLFEDEESAMFHEAEQKALRELRCLVPLFINLVDNEDDIVDELWRHRTDLIAIFAPLVEVRQKMQATNAARVAFNNSDVPF